MKKIIILVGMLLMHFFALTQNNCKVWSYLDFRDGKSRFLEAEWTGNIIHGKASGYGTAYFDDGSRFTGTMEKGVPQGVGKFLVKNSGPRNNGISYMVVICDWDNGQENGTVVHVYFPGPWLGHGWQLKYVSGTASHGKYTGTWYGYDQNGTNIGWLSSENGNYTVHHQDIDLSSIVGITAGLGVGLVGLAAIAAASAPADLFILIIIY